jgi:hypothetical protein
MALTSVSFSTVDNRVNIGSWSSNAETQFTRQGILSVTSSIRFKSHILAPVLLVLTISQLLKAGNIRRRAVWRLEEIGFGPARMNSTVKATVAASERYHWNA